jgi:hypothetical protein
VGRVAPDAGQRLLHPSLGGLLLLLGLSDLKQQRDPQGASQGPPKFRMAVMPVQTSAETSMKPMYYENDPVQ